MMVKLHSIWPPGRIVYKIPELLLENDSNINVSKVVGWKPLLIAARHDHLNIANSLIKHKAVIDLKKGDGHITPHMAAWENRVHIFELLLENGSDNNMTDNEGGKPLDCCPTWPP